MNFSTLTTHTASSRMNERSIISSIQRNWLEEQELLQCIHRDDIDGIQEWLQNGANPNKTMEDGWTCFLAACYYGRFRSVRTLIECSTIDFQQQRLDNGSNALFLACQGEYGEQVKLVRYLMNQTDIPLDQPRNTGATPLFIATERGHASVVRLLLQEQKQIVDVDRALTDGGITPLYIACHKGWTKTVQCLVEEGNADVNKAEANGSTPLNAACYEGHTSIVRILVTKGKACARKAMKTSGISPLHSAARMGHLAIAQCLIEEGGRVNVNQRDFDGETALHMACRCGLAQNALVQYLCKEAGAKIHLASKKGMTPFMVACQQRSKEHLSVAKYLWATGKVDVNQANRIGQTPLMLACQSHAPHTLRWLLCETNASIRKHDKNGKTVHDCLVQPEQEEENRTMNRIFHKRARFIQRRWDLIQYMISKDWFAPQGVE